MLPPDPPRPNLPNSVANDHGRDPGRAEAEGSAPGQAEPARISMPHAGLGGPRRLALSRLVLLALSTAGVGAAFVLLVTGHLTMAARVLAGDVLLIFGILMIA